MTNSISNEFTTINILQTPLRCQRQHFYKQFTTTLFILLTLLNFSATSQYLLKNTESEKLLQDAEMAFNANKIALSDSLINQCILYDQKNSTAYFLRAKIREHQGYLIPALVDYEAVILLDPIHQEVRFKKALILYRLENYSAAIDDINVLLQNESYYATTTVFFEMNDKNEVQGMKTIHTMQSDLYNLRGLCNHGLSQYQKALHDYDIASSIAKNNPDYYINTALTHIALFDTVQAISSLKKAILLQPNSELAKYNLKALGEEVPQLSAAELKVTFYQIFCRRLTTIFQLTIISWHITITKKH
jgi:tetratricopeptide (TPR) repeat protein